MKRLLTFGVGMTPLMSALMGVVMGALTISFDVSAQTRTHSDPINLLSPSSSSNYSIISPNGVTNVLSTGNGSYLISGPKGVTSVLSNGSGYTIVSPKGVTSVLSSGGGNYTIIGPDQDFGQVLSVGDNSLLMLDD